MNISPKKTILFLLGIIIASARPLLGPRGVCRFTPTCTVYTQQAIEKYGFLKGLRLSALRVAKCHPFHTGGYDPVP